MLLLFSFPIYTCDFFGLRYVESLGYNRSTNTTMTLATVIDSIRTVLGDYRDALNDYRQTVADLRKLNASKDVALATLQAQFAKSQPDITAALSAKAKAEQAVAAVAVTTASEKTNLDALHAGAEQLQAFLTAIPKPVGEDNYSGVGPHTPLATPVEPAPEPVAPVEEAPVTPIVEPVAPVEEVAPVTAEPVEPVAPIVEPVPVVH
jgi:hypothetical protein